MGRRRWILERNPEKGLTGPVTQIEWDSSWLFQNCTVLTAEIPFQRGCCNTLSKEGIASDYPLRGPLHVIIPHLVLLLKCHSVKTA
jgi:hypothetical protein